MFILPLPEDSHKGHSFLPRHWWWRRAQEAQEVESLAEWRGGGESNVKRKGQWRAGRGGSVILVIKDRVVSMLGVWTGCGKLLESLRRKAAPFLLCPFSGDLIIFSNSQDGILHPLFPHLLLTSFYLSFPFLFLFSVTLKCTSDFQSNVAAWKRGDLWKKPFQIFGINSFSVFIYFCSMPSTWGTVTFGK